MLWYYEDEEIFASDDGSDIKYDAEVMNSFTDALCSDLDRYRERARALEKEYVRYHNNDTFVGEMADDSKRFIYDVQGDELHMKNLELKREFLNLCLSIENKFKEEVDPSPKARVSVGILSKIKNDYNRVYNAADTKGYELECHGKQVVDILGKWGVSTVPYCRRLVESLDGFCGHGKMLDKDIQKLETFDREACALIDRKDLTGYANDLQRKIKHTAGVLDSMTVYQPDVAKHSVGVVSLSAMGAVKNNPFTLFKELLSASKKKNPVVITDPKYLETMQKEFGFTEEEATLLYTAYTRYVEKYPSELGKEYNDAKIKQFYSNLAALHEGYAAKYEVDFKNQKSGDIIQDIKENFKYNIIGNIKRNLKPFNVTGVTPNHQEAIAFFNALGVDGNELKEAIERQHSSCLDNRKRDFVHECAIFALMAEHKGCKDLGSVVAGGEDIDALIGYKGDIYSGDMGIDDIKSDIAAYNIYYRMSSCKNGNIWEAMNIYNEGVSDNSINGSKEFLAHFGDGDPNLGMDTLKIDLDTETKGTKRLNGNPENIALRKKEFLSYVSKESGVALE